MIVFNFSPHAELDPKQYDQELYKRNNIGYSTASAEQPSGDRKRLRKIKAELRNDKELMKKIQKSECKFSDVNSK